MPLVGHGGTPISSWSFVGRSREMATAQGWLSDGRHVVLQGPAGCGKSRLAGEIVAAAAATGVLTRRIAGSPSATPIPLAALSALVEGDIGGDIVSRSLLALEADGRSGAGDPILLVDDAHSLDDASAVAVHQIGLSGRVRLVMTVRAGSPAPPALGRLLAEPGVERLDMPPLDDVDVADLLHTALDGPLETRSLDVLVRTSQGNPLFLRELVVGSIDAGVLTRSEGLWRFRGDVRVTPQLAEVVMARIAPLPAAQRDAMEILAIGGSLDLAFASRLVDLEDLESLERAGLVSVRRETVGDVLDVAHPLHRELIRAQLGPLARMRVLRQLAEADAAVPGPRTAHDELRGVVWRVRGGLEVPGDRLMHAALAAMAAFDTPLGAELAELAFRATGDRDAALVAGWCLAEHGRADAAIALTTEALGTADDPLSQAALRQRVAEYEWWFNQDLERGRVIIDVELPDPHAQALLVAQDAVFSMLDGRLDRALDVSRPFVADHPLFVRFTATVAHAQALVYADRPDEGAALAGALFTEALAHPNDLLATDPGVHVVPQVLGLLHAGRFDEARSTIEFVTQVAESQQGIQPRGFAAIVGGFVALLGGRPSEGARLLREAESHWAQVSIRGIARWAALGQVLCHAATGELDHARAAADRAAGYPSDGFRLYEAFAPLGATWICVADRDVRGAVDAAEEAIAVALGQGAVTHLAIVAHDLARLGLHGQAAAACAALPGDLTSLAALRRDSALALADADATVLEDLATQWQTAGSGLHAAELLTVASAAHRRGGRSKDHQRCDGLAGQLLVGCGPVATPLLSARSSDGVLSRRETEIAELAASGLSNKEIAQRLIIGERTVESHLYRVFTKLGIGSRDQIAGALGR